jgi:hypothetical protein
VATFIDFGISSSRTKLRLAVSRWDFCVAGVAGCTIRNEQRRGVTAREDRDRGGHFIDPRGNRRCSDDGASHDRQARIIFTETTLYLPDRNSVEEMFYQDTDVIVLGADMEQRSLLPGCGSAVTPENSDWGGGLNPEDVPHMEVSDEIVCRGKRWVGRCPFLAAWGRSLAGSGNFL